MDYELIALDLDETLLNHKKEISPRNLKAIRDAHDMGVRIVIATGRAFAGIGRFRDELGIKDYCVTTAGGFVNDKDGNVVHGAYLDPEVTWALMNWAAERGIYFQVYLADGFRYPNRTRYTEAYEKACEYSGTEDPSILSRHDLKAGKVLFVVDPQDMDKYREAVERDFPALCVETSSPIFLEVSTYAASKGNGIRALAGMLGIPREKVIAFGDSEIDTSMIEWAGMGVAMANAEPSVLEAADYVGPSCEEDGVAKVVEEFVLGR